ncbi:MAG: DNA polymerase IV [Angustibacter sp.]
MATVLHADLDAFYASVEQLLDPTLRRRPIAVGGSATGGVVLAASYEARSSGVRGGMAGWRARRLCPSLIFVPGHFGEYQRLADAVMDVLHDVTPAVERVSIDEAFLDVSGSVHLFGSPETIAARLRRQVRDRVGLPISVGVARTKHLAKVASQVAKPDGLVVVHPGREQWFLDPLPVGLMWGVGPVAQRRLADRGIRTIGELARVSPAELERVFGRAVGAKLSALSHNEDPRRVVASSQARSVGAQSALGRQHATAELVREVLAHLVDRVAGRLRASGQAARTVTVRVRFPGMRSASRACTLPVPVATTLTLTEVAERLAWQAIRDEYGARSDPQITLLAVSASKLSTAHAVQAELPALPDDPLRPGSPTGAARWALDLSVDAVRRRFGQSAVAYLPVTLGSAASVPDAFRELAERDL